MITPKNGARCGKRGVGWFNDLGTALSDAWEISHGRRSVVDARKRQRSAAIGRLDAHTSLLQSKPTKIQAKTPFK